MADFRTSTHREKWIFTTHDLAAKYEAANRRAIHTLEKYGVTRMEVDEDGTLLYRETPVNPSAEKHSRPKPLSIEEESFLRIFYENKLREVCGAFYFPHKIQATALIYFKRFYLQWSVMEHHPKDIIVFSHLVPMIRPVLISTDLDLHGYGRPKHFVVTLILTCIYAACKIEENHVSAEELGKGISQDHQVILNSEMLVLQSLEFDLIVYAPYRSVEGFAGAMMEFCHGEDDQMQMLKATAVEEVDKIMLTDAPLLFPPGQLALAALRQSNEVHRILDFESYFGSEPLLQNSSHSFAELNELLSAIDSLVKTYKFPSEKDMKHINRKLKSCWGLSSHDDSKKREKKSKHKSKHNVNDTENGLSFT